MSGVAILIMVGFGSIQFVGKYRVTPEFGASAGVILVGAAAAFFAYRLSADPALLFVAMGAAGVGANLVMFDLIWLHAGQRFPLTARLSSQPLEARFANLAAWALFGICLLLANRQPERKDRSSGNPWIIVSAGLGGLGLVDLAIFFPTPESGATEHALAQVLIACAVLGLLVFASVRSTRNDARDDLSGWLACGAAVATGGPAVWLLASSVWVEDDRMAMAWYITVPFAVGAIIVFASLTALRPNPRSPARKSVED